MKKIEKPVIEIVKLENDLILTSSCYVEKYECIKCYAAACAGNYTCGEFLCPIYDTL